MASRPLLLLLLAACGTTREYPVRAPMWHDDDARPHASKPRAEVSTSGWSLADQTLFRPLTRFFAVDPAGEAINVNSVDEVPDSSWFQNRRIATAEELIQGPCTTGELDPATFADGSWVIDKGKMDGITPGFRVKVPGRGRFMVKVDAADIAHRSQAAGFIGSRLYWAAGYNVPCERIVWVRSSLFSIQPGLFSLDNVGVKTMIVRETVDAILGRGLRDGDRVRVSVSEFVEGEPLGPFLYHGTRDDDPNDVVRHDDRRDLRGLRVLAAWIHHFDSRDQNTLTTWIGGERGYVRHYLIDFSDSFGTMWAWDGISRRIGHSYYFDLGDVVTDFFSFGLVEKAYDRAVTDEPVFHYYGIQKFDPAKWKPGYPNPAFGRMRERDAAWMARILARLEPAQLHALVAEAGLPADRAAYLERTLLARRQAILSRYLARVSPLADVRIEGSTLCALDLARTTRAFPRSLFGYSSPDRPVDVRADGTVCVPLGSGPRYEIVSVGNGIAAPLRAHIVRQDGRIHLVGVAR